MKTRIKALAKKELKQLSRDFRMLFILFFFPVFLLVIFGYAVNFDVENVQLAVLDKDNTKLTRDFIDDLNSTDYFQLVGYLNKDSQVKQYLDNKEAQAVMVFPSDFSRNAHSGKLDAEVQILIDGVNSNTATSIYNYLNAAVINLNYDFKSEFYSSKGIKISNPIKLDAISWFNPELSTPKFLIPGLIGMILIITAVISVSLTMVREKERGTIEQINVSSVSTIELLVGKSIPYILIAFIDAVLILIAGYILFDIIIKGSLLLLFISTLIFILSSVSLGIFVSVVADSQQVAFTIATFASLLPSVILSGFIFPIDSMPKIIQIITNITPVKFYLVALRSIILKGVGLYAFWDQWLYLILYGGIFIILGIAVRKKKLTT